MKGKIFFWGTFLIFLGLFLLMNNFGIFKVNFTEILDWWPIILIIWGIALLKIPDVLKNILLALSGLLFSLFIVTAFSTGSNFVGSITSPGDVIFDVDTEDCVKQQEKPDDKIKRAKLNFSGGAGSFNFGTTDDFLYKIESGFENCEVDTDQPNDTTLVLNYSVGDGNINGSNSRYNMLYIYSQPIWDVDISAGASKMDINLKELKMENLSIDAGASTITISIGEIVQNCKVSINCGAATFKIIIPKNSGCSVQGDMALSKVNFEGLDKNSAGVYITDNYYNSKNKIDFYIDGALSNFNIIRE